MRVLFVGENPYGISGCSSLLREIVKQVKSSRHELAIFSATHYPNLNDVYSDDTFKNIPIIQGHVLEEGIFANDDLIRTLTIQKFDLLVFVGFDCWRFITLFPKIKELRQKNKFKWMSIFPYDLYDVRGDWVEWIKTFDYPMVYSEYGYDLLKNYVPNLRYFRPPIPEVEKLVVYSNNDRAEIRRRMFPSVKEEEFLFGFIGANQIRKDPQRLIHSFFLLKADPDLKRKSILYLHTEFGQGVFNLEQYAAEKGGDVGDVILKKQRFPYPKELLVQVYNALDCMVNVSFQEGLSLTVLEALLCGTPVLASDNTAHKELLRSVGGLIPCKDIAFIPVMTERGTSFINTKSCSVESLVSMMKQVVNDDEYRNLLRHNGFAMAREWVKGCHNIVDILDEIEAEPEIEIMKEKAVLFVQHSSAGDVLMSTQCFKGLKERHLNVPFYYMTQSKYSDIVKNNPYIDRIIDWDDRYFDKYEVIYNPHGEKILPGGWNNGDVRLHDMYPYFCNVKADDMFIDLVKPEIELPEEYIIVQTSGGSKEYRTYDHMDIVIKKLPYPTVLIGEKNDKFAKADYDLSGKLTWREGAWVMKNAKLAIVIDSFPSHLAGALKTPAVVLFGPAPARVTGPKGDMNKMIFLEPDKLKVCPILSNCWGNAEKTTCQTPCINSISPFTVIKSALDLLGR
jgi:glycosyltransferase involved in cell wall biosynthesis